jgi:hypothetical protein
MSPHREDDALVSPRVAADLCGIPTARVLALLSSKALRPVTVQGRQLVSLRAVEAAIGEGYHDPSL